MTRADPVGASGTPGQRAAAWAVHLFTATGGVLALLALLATVKGRFDEALLWLFAALVVDGVDGSFARAARVKERAPRIDGDVLDLVIDYLTYVFVPTLFLWRAGLIPESLVVPLGALIQLSSLYVFARRDMKTDDGYFRGYPALWNVVALYLYAIAASPAAGAVTVAVFVVLAFAPIHVVHPFRVRDFGRALPVLALAWAAATLGLLVPGLDGNVRQGLLLVSLAASAILIALGLWRTARGERPAGRVLGN